MTDRKEPSEKLARRKIVALIHEQVNREVNDGWRKAFVSLPSREILNPKEVDLVYAAAYDNFGKWFFANYVSKEEHERIVGELKFQLRGDYDQED